MQVALTFDNNYQSPDSLRILQTLQENQVPATFFLIGNLVSDTPQLTAALRDEGFEVGDQTFSYADCTSIPQDWLPQEIGGGTEAYLQQTGMQAAPLFRPPRGTYDDRTLVVLAEKGFSHLVLWDVDSKDATGISAQEIIANVVGNVHDGAIILLHLDGANTAQALPGIIAGIREKGFTFVTVTELLDTH